MDHKFSHQEKKCFTVFYTPMLFLLCKDLFYGDKIYFVLRGIIRNGKIFNKKRKNRNDAI